MVLTSNRRRTAGITALFAAILLILTTLFVMSPAGAQATEHCPDHEGHPGKTQGSEAEGAGGLILDAGTVVCLKKSTDTSGTFIADGETTLYEYLQQFDMDGNVDEGPSYYIVYEVLELCPEGTDNAGTPIDQVESCDEVEVCPEGTDNAGTPIDEVESCDEVEVCPDDTDNAGTPIDEVESCDEVEVDECPEGTDNAGTPIDEVEACDEETEVEPSVTPPTTPDEVEVLPNVIEKPAPTPAPAAQPAAQVAAQELPATGLGSTELLLLALLLMGLGASALLAPERSREY